VLQTIGTVAALVVPTLNGSLIDDGIARHYTPAVWQAGSLMIAAAVLQFATLAGVAFLGSRIATAVGAGLRDALFTRAQEFSVREVAAFGAPSLITRITNDVQQVQMLVVIAITMLAPAPLVCLGGIVLALRQDVPLSATLLVDLPAMAVIFTAIVRRLRAPMGARQRYLDTVNTQLREQVTGVRVIRAFNLEAAGRERFARTNDDLQRVARPGHEHGAAGHPCQRNGGRNNDRRDPAARRHHRRGSHRGARGRPGRGRGNPRRVDARLCHLPGNRSIAGHHPAVGSMSTQATEERKSPGAARSPCCTARHKRPQATPGALRWGCLACSRRCAGSLALTAASVSFAVLAPQALARVTNLIFAGELGHRGMAFGAIGRWLVIDPAGHDLAAQRPHQLRDRTPAIHHP
jgi:ABC-type multidrug transport system fused ATPase/permease subunit